MENHSLRKVKCEACGWRGTSGEIMEALNPWDGYAPPITGCPECFEVNSEVVVCDETDCWSEVTCGIPTDNGYRTTCSKHKP